MTVHTDTNRLQKYNSYPGSYPTIPAGDAKYITTSCPHRQTLTHKTLVT
jgi:hypothetical protein